MNPAGITSTRPALRIVISVLALVLAALLIWPVPSLWHQDHIDRADLIVRTSESWGLPQEFPSSGISLNDAIIATAIVTWTGPLRIGDSCSHKVTVGMAGGGWHLLNVMAIDGQQVVAGAVGDPAVTIKAKAGSPEVVHLSFIANRANHSTIQAALNGRLARAIVQRTCGGARASLDQRPLAVTSELRSS